VRLLQQDIAGIKSEERSQFKGRVPLIRSPQVLSAVSGPARPAPRNGS